MSEIRRGRRLQAHLGRGLSLLLIVSALFAAGVPTATADDSPPPDPKASPAPSDPPTEDAPPGGDEPAKQGAQRRQGLRAAAPSVQPGFVSIALSSRASQDRNRNNRLDAGDVVPYVAKLSNRYNGKYVLHNVSVTSSRTGAMSCTATILKPGQFASCSGSVTVTAEDVRASKISNSVKAYGYTVDSGATAKTSPTTRAAGDVTVSNCSTYNAPGTSDVSAGTFFNRPYGSWSQRNNLRNRVIRAVNSTPQCQTIVMSVYSINDPVLISALINAWRRGVVVKVMTNSHMVRGATRSKPFVRLQKTIGASTRNSSWARACSRSCRGRAGNHHYKMYLFSQAHRSRNVTMMGSHNSTLKAVNGQWNHMDVYNNEATFDKYLAMFREVALDRPQAHPYREYTTGDVTTWFFPRPGTGASNDPMMRQLAGIQCGGVAKGYGRNGRTLIRVGMYAWHDSRGVWLAKRVRALWNAGCDVAVEYAIIGNTVKRILYSPAGRGRIPMRQVTTSSRNGTILNYTHEKYVTISGHKWSYRNAELTVTGTTNWANLGFSSDDTTQVWHDRNRAARYRSDFYGIWRGPKAHVPSPTSALPGQVGKGNLRLGKGKYKNLEN